MWDMLGDKVFPTSEYQRGKERFSREKSSVIDGSCWDSNRNKSNVNAHW